MLQYLTPQLLVSSGVKRRYTCTKKSEIVETGHAYTACDDSMHCHSCFSCLGQMGCGAGHAHGHQLILVKRRSCSEDADSIKNDALDKSSLQTTADEHLRTTAAMSCLESGYSKEKVLSAVNIFIAKYGNNEFKGKDLCEIIFDIEDNVSEDIESHVTGPSTETETKKGGDIGQLDAMSDEDDIDLHFEEEKCKACTKNEANILSLAYNHVISCPLCTPVLMLVTHPSYGHMWYQSSY